MGTLRRTLSALRYVYFAPLIVAPSCSGPPPSEPPALIHFPPPATADDPLEIPIDNSWTDGEGQSTQMERVVDFDAAPYNLAEIELLADAPARVALWWTSDLQPEFDPELSVESTVFGDGEYRTYRFALSGYNGPRWAGHITSLRVVSASPEHDVVLRALRFRHDPNIPPSRHRFSGRTIAGSFTNYQNLRVRVPANAVFETYVSVLPADAGVAPDYGRVEFELNRVLPTGELRRVGSRTFDSHRATVSGGWNRFAVGLSELAGEEVELQLGITHGPSNVGDFAVWGEPKVYSKSPHNSFTPVILISCDTVRADHLSCYGYERETTPNIDALARESVLFENAYTPVSWTLQAHMSMVTGLHPQNHGVTIDANLPEDVETLPEELRAAGYHTAGFAGFRGWLAPEQGFAQGFDVYETPLSMVRSVHQTHGNAVDWLRTHAVPNVFLFLHNYEAHALLDAPGAGPQLLHENPELYGFTAALVGTAPSQTLAQYRANGRLEAASDGGIRLKADDRALNVAFYDDSIRIVDSALGEFFSELKRLGLYDAAFILVTSDHGESLGEHGSYSHDGIYENELHVPMIMKFPGGAFAGVRRSETVYLMDIMPTILDAVGCEIPKGLDGVSLLPSLTDIDASFSPRDLYLTRLNWRGIRTGQWKLADPGGGEAPELYDLINDPLESTDIAPSRPGLVAQLVDKVNAFYAPPPYGWFFEFRQPNGEADTLVAVETPSRFSRDWIAGSGFWQSNAMNTQDAVTRLEARLGGATDYTTQLNPEGAEQRLTVHLESDVRWMIQTGGRRYTGTQLSFVLDPASVNRERPAPVEGSETPGPTLTIWYRPPEREQSAASAVSEDDRKALEALGYLN